MDENFCENFIINSLTFEEKIKKVNPVRLKYNGKFVVLGSGKHTWNNIGFAKAAVRHHIKTLLYQEARKNKEVQNDFFYGDLEQRCFDKFFSLIEVVPA